MMLNRFGGKNLGRLMVLVVVWLIWASAGGVLAAEPASGPLRLVEGGESLLVKAEGRPVLRYRHTGVPFKPYVKELFTPGGVQVLRDSPHDHIHHHALMFAVKVERVDFWGEDPKRRPGTQAGGRLTLQQPDAKKPARKDGLDWAGFTHEITWTSARKTPLLAEKREIKVFAGKDLDATLLTWRCELQPAAGKEAVRLSGPVYVGLGMRFVQSMDAGGEFSNSSGKKGRELGRTHYVVPAKWSAYTAAAGGKPVTVAIFDHPDNQRHPAGMFYMSKPFAYLSATLKLRESRLSIKAGSPLVLRYGVAVWDGKTDAEKVEQLYRRWIALQ